MLDKTNADALLKLLEHADLIVAVINGKQVAFDPKMFAELRKHVAWDGVWPES